MNTRYTLLDPIYGAQSGNWGYRRNSGISSCYLLSNPTKPIDSYGAYISGDWWYRQYAGAFYCNLGYRPYWATSDCGAKENMRGGITSPHIIFYPSYPSGILTSFVLLSIFTFIMRS